MSRAIAETLMLIDVRVLPGIDYVMDIESEELPLPENSVSKMLAIDVLEHISWRNIKKDLENLAKKLKPGGVLHIRTPDVARIYEKAIKEGYRAFFAFRFEILSYWLGGNQDYPENTHKTFWDVQALVELLSSIGLTSTCTHDEGVNMVCDAVKPV